MASMFHKENYRDYLDLKNETGRCPGFELGIRENDGGIGIWMDPLPGHKTTPHGTSWDVFLSVEEAKRLLENLQAAIDQAASKH